MRQQTLRSGLTLFPEQQALIEQQLTELSQKLPARFILLTDVTGQIILAKGQHNQMNLVALGSLVAGDLAASQEIARFLGEYEAYQLVLREGQHSHTFICEAGHYLILLVQVSADVPLGWGRMLIQKVAHQLAEWVATSPATVIETKLQFDVSDDLSELFSNALDDLWKE